MRKMQSITTFLVLSLLLMGAVVSANPSDLGPELLFNPGFEIIEGKLPPFIPADALFRMNPPGWAHYKVPIGWGWTTEEVHSGRLAIKIVSQPDASAEAALFYQTLEDLDLSPGDAFRLELAAKPYVRDTSSFRIAIRLRDAKGSWTDIVLGEFPVNASETWIPMSFDFELPNWVKGREGVSLRVGFRSNPGGTAGDYVYIDDVSLKRVLSSK